MNPEAAGYEPVAKSRLLRSAGVLACEFLGVSPSSPSNGETPSELAAGTAALRTLLEHCVSIPSWREARRTFRAGMTGIG